MEAAMAKPQPGSQVAKELGLALGQVYSYVKSGKVTNHKEGGYPLGKGIEVDPDEVRAAMANRKQRAPREPKAEGEEATEPRTRRMKRSKEFRESTRGDNRDYGRATRNLRRCPVDPDHGYLVANNDPKSSHIWLCTHQAHDDTKAPTQLGFTDEEAQYPHPVGTLGRVMLLWIAEGRADLAAGLEDFLDAHDVPVWIPAR